MASIAKSRLQAVKSRAQAQSAKRRGRTGASISTLGSVAMLAGAVSGPHGIVALAGGGLAMAGGNLYSMYQRRQARKANEAGSKSMSSLIQARVGQMRTLAKAKAAGSARKAAAQKQTSNGMVKTHTRVLASGKRVTVRSYDRRGG